MYEEALELEAFTQKIKRMHPDLSVIQDIVKEVRLSSDVLLYQLHEQLRTNVQLPVCLRIIEYLKRLGVYNEQELRLSFLHSRGSWLRSTLHAISSTNSYNYVRS
jgi:hypothetical protein